MHGAFLIISHLQQIKPIFDQISSFAIIFSGLIHDVDHSGTTN